MSEDQAQSASSSQMTESKKASNTKSRNTKQNRQKLGFVYLSANLESKQHLRLFPAQVISILQDETFLLPFKLKKQQIQIWDQRFSYIEQANFIQFQGCGYRNQSNLTILTSIQHIKFNQLKFMNFYNAGIQNFQPFSYLNTPGLQKLSISNNLCHNFSSLAKMNTPSLTYLCLQFHEQNLTFRSDRVVQNININNKVPPVSDYILTTISKPIYHFGFGLTQRYTEKQKDLTKIDFSADRYIVISVN